MRGEKNKKNRKISLREREKTKILKKILQMNGLKIRKTLFQVVWEFPENSNHGSK